jgi:hypothetical protein
MMAPSSEILRRGGGSTILPYYDRVIVIEYIVGITIEAFAFVFVLRAWDEVVGSGRRRRVLGSSSSSLLLRQFLSTRR